MTDRAHVNSSATSEVVTEYPPPPWRLGGEQWAGLFHTENPVQATSARDLGAKPIFSRRLGIALLQYSAGTLCYDELIVGVLVRIGWKPCLWIRDIWVSDVRSQAAGIDEWNLPKQLANFHREGNRVRVEDDRGLVVSIRAERPRTHWPWGFGVVPIAGSKDGSWKTANGVWRGRVSFAKPVVEHWSDRFAERLVPGRGFGFSSPRFWMTVYRGQSS